MVGWMVCWVDWVGLLGPLVGSGSLSGDYESDDFCGQNWQSTYWEEKPQHEWTLTVVVTCYMHIDEHFLNVLNNSKAATNAKS